ncbi:lysine-specific demethylase 8-like [Babylonia areolata]|uniref:lysine-specific demethylase 8-like n=1 Tax=Babylonia areolata TaxID=304850 RepID=UPI003FD53E21
MVRHKDGMSRLVVFPLSFITCFLISEVKHSTNAEKIPGHRRPLGAHSKPYGVTVIGKFSSPQVFYGHFVKASKPIHMKSALTETKHPGLEWTDEYLRNHYGQEMVRVEIGKKEVRHRNAQWMRLNNFLSDYADNDLYMVNSIKDSMEGLVHIPSTLQCGGFEKGVMEAVLWMGRGPIHSVLHYDELENLLCVFDGAKDVILIDQFYKDKVESRGFVQEGHYSQVDPESVDMHRFPQFQNLPWYRVHLDAGDCLFIPYGWYHQVTSYGDRNLALNIWFSHIWWFNDDSCEDFSSFPHLKPLDKFGGFASPNEAVRSQWLEKFEGSDDDVDFKDFSRRVSSGTKDDLKKAFSFIDHDKDDSLSWEELTSFDINRGLLQYPSVFYSHSTSAKSEPAEESSSDAEDAAAGVSSHRIAAGQKHSKRDEL